MWIGNNYTKVHHGVHAHVTTVFSIQCQGSVGYVWSYYCCCYYLLRFYAHCPLSAFIPRYHFDLPEMWLEVKARVCSFNRVILIYIRWIEKETTDFQVNHQPNTLHACRSERSFAMLRLCYAVRCHIDFIWDRSLEKKDPIVQYTIYTHTRTHSPHTHATQCQTKTILCVRLCFFSFGST